MTPRPPHRDGRDQRLRPRHRQARHPLHHALPVAGLARAVRAGGRAARGRDGRRANCILLYAPDDRDDPRGAALAEPRAAGAALQARPRARRVGGRGQDADASPRSRSPPNLGTRTTAALLALLEEASSCSFDATAVYVIVPADEIEERVARARRPVRDAAHAGRAPPRLRRRLRARHRVPRRLPARYFGEDVGVRCGLCDRCRGRRTAPTASSSRSRRRGAPRGAAGRSAGATPSAGALVGATAAAFRSAVGARIASRHSSTAAADPVPSRAARPRGAASRAGTRWRAATPSGAAAGVGAGGGAARDRLVPRVRIRTAACRTASKRQGRTLPPSSRARLSSGLRAPTDPASRAVPWRGTARATEARTGAAGAADGAAGEEEARGRPSRAAGTNPRRLPPS